MIKFAVFHYDGNKEGFEKWQYLKDIEGENPTGLATLEFYNRFNFMPDEVRLFDSKVVINNVLFARMFTAFKKGNGYREIVIAERYNNKTEAENN